MVSPQVDVMATSRPAYEEFLKLSKRVDDNIKIFNLNNYRLSRIDEALCIENVGFLSPRALGNLSRILSVPKGLLQNLTTETLNMLVGEQLTRKKVGEFRTSNLNGVLAFLQPVEQHYLDYSKIFGGLTNVYRVSGDPITHDVIRVYASRGEIIPDDGHALSYGSMILVSSVDVVKPQINDVSFRYVCSNGLIGGVNSQEVYLKTKNPDEVLLRQVFLNAVTRSEDTARRTLSLYNKAVNHTISTNSDLVIDDIQSVIKLPSRLLGNLRVTANSIEEGSEEFEKVGISGMSNVWNYVNLITYLVQAFPSFVAIDNVERSALRWAKLRINESVL